MSNSIDQRVVEMKFENEKFEKGIATSLKSLENLKKGLDTKDYAKNFNSTLSQIANATKNVSFSAMAAGIQSIQDRFSTLGIIGMRVIQNLTDTMMNFATKTVRFVTDAVVSGGVRRAMNIENAHFQLQGLLKDEERVQAVMDDAMWSVDGTAYAYDEAAKAASQFAASGLEAGDEMRSALRAITGVAAMTNSDYESISRIFTTVAGNGRLMGEQLLSLSSRGLNAAATLAEYFNKVNDGSTDASDSVTEYVRTLTGGLQIGEGEIRKFISEGKLSFEIFSNAMDDAFGEHAKKANETFTGALSNVKAALSRIGAEFVSPLVVQNGPIVQLFNALRVQINELKKGIIPLAKSFTDAVNGMASTAAKFIESIDLTYPIESFYNVLSSIKNIFSFIGTFIKPIKEAFVEIFPKITPEKIAKLTGSIKDFTSTLSVSSSTLDKVKRIFKGVFSVLSIGRSLLWSVAKGFVSILETIWPTNTGFLEFLATIGDNLVAIKDYVKENDIFGEAVTKIVEKVAIARDKIREFTDLVKAKMEEYPFLDGLLSLLDRIRQRIGTIFDFFKKVKDAVSEVFGKVAENLSDTGALDILPKIEEIFVKVFGTILDVVKNITKTFSSKLLEGDFVGFFDTLNAFILGFTGLKINSVFGSLDTMIYKFSGFGSLIKRNLSEIKLTLIEYQSKLKADSLMTIAEAIGVLALSLLVLSGIDSKSLSEATAAMAALFGELVGSMSLLHETVFSSGSLKESIGQTMQWRALAEAMIKMAAAVLILSFAMKSLSTLDWDGIAKGLVAVGGLALIVTGMAFAMSKMGGKMSTGAVGLVIMAAAISMLAKVCKDLATMEWEGIGKGLVAVGGLMLELAVFSRFAKSGIFNSTGILILVASVKLLVGVFKDLATMGLEEAEDGLKTLGALLAELAVFTKIASGSKNMISTGLGVVLLSASLVILTNVLKELNAMDQDSLKNSLAAVGASLIMFSLALNFASGTFGGSMAILVAVAAIAALTPVLKSLGAMPFNDILQGLFAVVTVLGALVAAGYLAKPVIGTILGLAGAIALLGLGFVGIGAGLLLFSSGLTVLAAGLSAVSGSLAVLAAGIVGFLGILLVGILGLIPDIINVGTRIVIALAEVVANAAPAIILALSALVGALAEALPDILGSLISVFSDTFLEIIETALEVIDNHVESIVDTAFSIIIKVVKIIGDRVPELVPVLMDAIGKIGLSLKNAFGSMDPMSVVAFFGGITVLSLVFKLLASTAKDAIKSAITVALMLVLIGGITASFLLLKELDGVETLAKATALTEIMLALAGVMAVLQAVPITGALTAIADMDLMILNLVAVLTALGALYEIPGLSDLIDSGSEFLSAIGGAIGGFVGSIVGGFAEGLSSGLPGIGQNLSDFITNSQTFFDAMDDMTETRMKAVGSLVTALLDFTKAELIDGVARWFGGGIDLVAFGEQLSLFAPYLKQFAEATEGIDDTSITVAANAAGMIAAFAKDIPNEGGLLSFIMGDNDLETFGSHLVAFGPNLKQFAEDVKGLDPDAVENAANIADMIIGFAKEVPNEGGLLAKIVGDNDLETFGQNIVKFGPNLKQFAEDVDGLKSTAVETASTAAGMIVAFAKEIPNQGGLLSWIVGDNKIDTFGEDLLAFGKGLKGYSDQVVLLNAEKITDSITLAEDLIDLGDKAPGADTTWNLNSLGGRLGGGEGYGTSFGEQMLTYSGYVESCNWGKINSATSAIKLLVDKLVEVSPEGPEAMKSFGEGLVAISNFTVDEFVNAIGNAKTAIETAGTNMMESFLIGLGKDTAPTSSEAYTIIVDILDAIGSAIADDTYLESISSSGSGIIESLGNGLTSASDSAKKAMSTVLDSLKESIRNQYTSIEAIGEILARKFRDGFRTSYDAYYNTGAYAIEGIVNGVTAKMEDVYDIGYKVGKRLTNGMENSLQEKSPSKATYRVGTFAALGLINSLQDNLKTVYNAGEDVGSSSLDGIRSAISNVKSILESDIDTQPVIRPVLDDSEIQNGVAGISALFNGSSYAYRGAASIAGRISAKNLTLEDGAGTTYNFNQYNNSPKALDRLEIYRQTKNLLSSTRARVGAT